MYTIRMNFAAKYLCWISNCQINNRLYIPRVSNKTWNNETPKSDHVWETSKEGPVIGKIKNIKTGIDFDEDLSLFLILYYAGWLLKVLSWWCPTDSLTVF